MSGKMKKFKDLLVDTPNRYTVNGEVKTIVFSPNAITREGTKDKAEYFNEMQKNGLYNVNATRIVEGTVEFYDIAIEGSDIFDVFDTQFIINFNETNTKLNPVLRFNGNNYYIRFIENFIDVDVPIGCLKKTYIGFLDSSNNKLKLIGYERKLTFDTVADMQTATWLVDGDTVQILGYYAKNDGGGHYRKIESSDDGSGILIDGLWANYIVQNGVTDVKHFGAKGDGIADDTLYIQKAIEYCSPFLWSGSVASTKSNSSNYKPKSELLISKGKFRITKGLTINPFIKIKGFSKGAFFGQRSSTILADYDDFSGAVIDSASFDSLGNKILGGKFARGDWDNGLYTGCFGWSIDSIGIEASSGRTVRTGINRAMAQQTTVKNCGIVSGNGRLFVGIRTTCSWGGNIENNHIITGMYAIENGYDTTIDYQKNNYLTIDISKKPTVLELDTFNHNLFPDDSIKNLSACIYNSYSNIISESNTCEGGEVGIKACNFSSIKERNYYEKIKKYIYAVHTLNGSLNPLWIVCPNSGLIWAEGADTNKMELNLLSCTYFSILNFGYLSNYLNGFLLIKSIAPISKFYDKNIIYDTITKENINLYIDPISGNDNNNGLNIDSAVKTIQGAIFRCVQGKKNIINIGANITVGTTRYFVDGKESLRTAKKFLDIEIIGNSNSTSIIKFSPDYVMCGFNLDDCKIEFKNLKIVIDNDATDVKYNICFQGKNSSFSFYDCIISSSDTVQKSLFGSSYGYSSDLKIFFSNTTLNYIRLLRDANYSTSWIENSNGSTFNNCITGSAGLKIVSKDFV